MSAVLGLSNYLIAFVITRPEDLKDLRLVDGG